MQFGYDFDVIAQCLRLEFELGQLNARFARDARVMPGTSWGYRAENDSQNRSQPTLVSDRRFTDFRSLMTLGSGMQVPGITRA